MDILHLEEPIRAELGPYRLMRRLGGVTGASVFLATRRSGERVVLRVYEGLGLTRREAFRRAALDRLRLRAPGLAPLREVAVERDVLYLVSPYFVGVSLQQILATLAAEKLESVQGPELLEALRASLPFEERALGKANLWERPAESIVADWMQQIADTLAALHSAGEAHGKVAASNILITPFGRAILIDAGIEPGESGASADFEGFREVFADLRASIGPRASEAFARIAFAIESEFSFDRYAGAKDASADLRRFLDGEELIARYPSAFRKSWRWTKKNPGRAVAGAFVVSILGAGMWLASGGFDNGDRPAVDPAFPPQNAAPAESVPSKTAGAPTPPAPKPRNGVAASFPMSSGGKSLSPR